MSPDYELVRLYGLDPCRERQSEAVRGAPLTAMPPTWWTVQKCLLLRRLGGQLIRAGRYLQMVYGSRRPIHA